MYQGKNIFIKSSGGRLAIRLIFLFVLFWALNFHHVQSHNNFSPGQARISYCSDASKKGHRLNATVYDDRHSLSRIDCMIQCVYEACCRSINYRKRDPFNGKENCELLHAVASEQPAEDLKEDKDYDYEILLQPNKPFDCHCSSCKNNGSCETSKRLCSCDSGFNGTQCEKDVNECSLSSNRCHQNSTCNNTVGSYVCTCNQGFTGNGINCTVPQSCADLYKNGVKENGVYIIDPDGEGAFNVSCDMTTDGGGWTVFQRRMDGSVDFYRGWSDYKNGFGNLNGEFWLGLDKINRLTKRGQDVLRVDLEDFEGETRYAKYANFSVADGADHEYKLKVEDYLGTAGSALDWHNGMMFTTKDKDNDKWSTGNCAVVHQGAWWYNHCHTSNLNGLYFRGTIARYGKGVIWYSWKGQYYSLKKTEMKIRPRNV